MPHMPAPRGSLVPWHIAASFPAHPKEPSPRGALPKHLLEECRVARLHRTPLQLTTSADQPLLTLGISLRAPASTRRCRHLFPRGKGVPAPAWAGRAGWLCHPCRQEAALGHRRAHSREMQGWLTLGTAREGDCSAPHSCVAFGCRWLLSHLPQPPPGCRAAPRRCQTLPGAD